MYLKVSGELQLVNSEKATVFACLFILNVLEYLLNIKANSSTHSSIKSQH